MHNNDGSIKYDKIKNGSRVWVLEEKEDGTYGKYALIENAQGLSDEKKSKKLLKQLLLSSQKLK